MIKDVAVVPSKSVYPVQPLVVQLPPIRACTKVSPTLSSDISKSVDGHTATAPLHPPPVPSTRCRKAVSASHVQKEKTATDQGASVQAAAPLAAQTQSALASSVQKNAIPHGSVRASAPDSPHSAVHINELLCFVQNQVNTVKRPVVVKLCIDFYTDEVIEASKLQLYDIVKPSDRLIRRRGDNKAHDNIMDICNIFYSLDVSKQPVFVAQVLSNLPSIRVKDINVNKILMELEEVQSSVKLLHENQVSLADNQVSLAETFHKHYQQSTQKPETSPHAGDYPVTGIDQTVGNQPVSDTEQTLDNQPQASTTAMSGEHAEQLTLSLGGDPLAHDVSGLTDRLDSSQDGQFMTVDYTTCSTSSELAGDICSDASTQNMSFFDRTLDNHSTPLRSPIDLWICQCMPLAPTHGVL
jgi:hypothetical protein